MIKHSRNLTIGFRTSQETRFRLYGNLGAGGLAISRSVETLQRCGSGRVITSKAMRYTILLGLCALSLVNSQTTDPNRTGFPHDMIWFNEPRNPQPGVTHHGYHSKSMNKEVGYNIW